MNMRRVTGKGNLPRHLQVLATELGGRLSSQVATEFYEMKTVAEFEKNAVEVGYEIVPTIDGSTGRGFLVGFGVSEPKKVATLLEYAQMKIYFVECSPGEIEEWTRKIQAHRRAQEADMRRRRESAQREKQKTNPLRILN